MREPDEIYHEEIGSFWGKLAVVLFFCLSLLFIILFFYQRAYGPIGGTDSVPDWFYLMILAIFLLIGLLVINFYSLTISATTSGIMAGYGRFRYRIPWGNVAGYEMDKGSALRHYGGYGIRYGFKNGRTVLVYNTMGSPLVLLELKKGNYKYFGFSTRRPDEVMGIIRSYTK
jgi:hypothetical protein